MGKILLCDDEDSLCRSLGRILRAAGHEVVAMDGIRGYSRLKEEPPSGFVRYSASRLGDTDFSKRIDEHGSIYVKVVRLKEKHPLVEFK